MELHDYLRLLKRAWLPIVLLAALGAAAGTGAATLQTPQYASSAKAFVSTRSGDSIGDLSSGAAFTAQAVKSYADIATTAYVLKPVIAKLGLATTTGELADRVAVTAADGEAVLQVTVTDASAARSARIADAITAQLATAVVDLTPDTSATATASVVKLTPVDPAVAPTAPVSPKPVLDAGIGAALGIVLAVVIALLRELLDTRIRSVQDLERVTDAPVLGRTVRDAQTRRHPLAVGRGAGGVRAEAYRTIRTNLRFVELDEARPSVVVTSALESEGKSTAAANLALAVASLGERVLLVDADLRRPSVAALFQVEGAVGLTDALVGTARLEDAVQRFEAGGLDLLPAGTIPPNPNELVQGRAMAAMLDRLHAEYDLVVFDSPPLLAVSDAAVLSARAGGTILVAAAGRVRRAQVELALDSLERASARLVGVVVTMLPRRGEDPAAYGYGHTEVAEPRKVRRTKARRPAVLAPDAGVITLAATAAEEEAFEEELREEVAEAPAEEPEVAEPEFEVEPDEDGSEEDAVGALLALVERANAPRASDEPGIEEPVVPLAAVEEESPLAPVASLADLVQQEDAVRTVRLPQAPLPEPVLLAEHAARAVRAKRGAPLPVRLVPPAAARRGWSVR